MKKSELRKLIREAIEEADRCRLDEGMGKEVAKKLIVWLFKKIATESPETFNKIDAAVKSKDENSLNAIFHDPNVEKEKKAIAETIIMESSGKNGFLSKIWKWIKSNPKISSDIALAIIGTLISLYFADGNLATFVNMVWPVILKSVAIGGVAGGIVKGGSNVFNQYKSHGTMGKVDWADAGKDAIAGAGGGMASGFAGGMLGGAGAHVANTAGAIAGGVTAKISDIIKALGESPKGETVFATIYKLRDNEKFPHLNNISSEIEKWHKWLFNDKKDALSLGDLEEEPVKTNLLKLLRGSINSSELDQIKKNFKAQHAAGTS